MTMQARSWYSHGSPRTEKRSPSGTSWRLASLHGTSAIDTSSECTSAAHSRRVPNPCVKSSCASFNRSAGQVEDDDPVLRGRPGAPDDALAVEFADDAAADVVGDLQFRRRDAGDTCRDSGGRA